ncbi:chaperone protein HtpG [Clostridia bacterium]|nr:chaperone protein HtpG [Clostridia bacterium]
MREFKTESKRILDMMINSVYTHREIFLRELISNASDAIDKLSYRSPDDYAITLSVDREARTLTVSDNGCGMTEEDLVENLGVIAHSGTKIFRDENPDKNETIGQFGVGFYSAFMVSKRVTVLSRSADSEQGYLWESGGTDGFTLEKADKPERGTIITLYLKDDEEDDGDKYGEYLEDYTLRNLIKKYSDYIRYPIKLGDDTLNSMIPLWRKPKSELTDEDYNNFYKEKFSDWKDPLFNIHYNTEGVVTYNSLLYIPSAAPMGFYSKDYQKGLQLYVNGVLIMDKCADLLPDHFGFVKGLVDSADLSLNISREILQQDRQLKAMAKSVEKKIRGELEKLLRDDRAKYEEFYGNFGLSLKYGLYQGFGMTNTELKDLILFRALSSDSLSDDRLLTLKEYREAMTEEQKYIYYVCAETPAKAALLPQTERVRAKGFAVLCLTDDVDEFMIKMLNAYDEKEFKSVSADVADLDEQEKETQAARTEENKDLLGEIKEALGGKVESVIISARLTSHPVCLTSEGELSLDMEKVLSAMPTPAETGGVKAKRVLELNAGHPVFGSLKNAEPEKLKIYANLLYAQALLIEGLSVDDPIAFSNDICSLMV